MKLILSTQVIDLPDFNSEYEERIDTTTERMDFVQHLLDTYPEEFQYSSDMFGMKYGQRQDNNQKVKIKLDILGRYILMGDPKYTNNVMSRYKEKRRPQQETPFSQFSNDMQEIQGWY